MDLKDVENILHRTVPSYIVCSAPDANMAGHACGTLFNWEYSSEPCFLLEHRQYSKSEVRARVAALTAGLRSLAPVGTCVAFAGLNSHRVLEAFIAISAAGCIVCPLNSRWSASEVQHAIKLTGSCILVSDSSFTSIQSAALAANPVLQVLTITEDYALDASHNAAATSDASDVATEMRIAELGTHSQSLEQLQQKHSGVPLELLKPPCDTALICFTSGTTAAAKGVRITHSALQMQSLAKLAVVGYCSRDVYLHVAPLFHIGGISSALAAVLAGSKHSFLPKFTAEDLSRAVLRYNVTAMIAVPTMLQDLVNLQLEQKRAILFKSMLRVLIGAGSTPVATVAAVASLMPHACIMSAYGMTEAASSITFDTLACPANMHADHAPGKLVATPKWKGVPQTGAVESHCVGFPAPGFQVAIEIVEDIAKAQLQEAGKPSAALGQRTLEPERVGEVVIRGAAVTPGYWGDPNATARAIDGHGWMHTGDLGWFDTSGRLMLCGRQKDMIKTGGENVHASEVESALAALAGVREAARVGLPHLRFGEAVSALLCVHRGSSREYAASHHPPHSSKRPEGTQGVQAPVEGSIWERVLGTAVETGAGTDNSQVPMLLNAHDLGLLQAKLKQAGLSAFKVPRVVAISAQPLPRTATGKVDKRTIKRLLQQLAASDKSAANSGTWHRSSL